MKLYGYWRSLAAYRVRIALNLKGLAWDYVPVDLLAGEQFADDYREINPQMVVPVLMDGDTALRQSMAILEYLEETHPEPSLLPDTPKDRARARALALISAADSHPLVVPRIRRYLTETLGHDEETMVAWARHWMTAGMRAMEETLRESDPADSGFCIGDRPTIADIGVVTHVTGARFFGCPADDFTRLAQVYETCMALDAFRDAQPANMPDAA